MLHLSISPILEVLSSNFGKSFTISGSEKFYALITVEQLFGWPDTVSTETVIFLAVIYFNKTEIIHALVLMCKVISDSLYFNAAVVSVI